MPENGIGSDDSPSGLYDREAVAVRVVEVCPSECWQVEPRVHETEGVSDD
jgi:hypothetical protein